VVEADCNTEISVEELDEVRGQIHALHPGKQNGVLLKKRGRVGSRSGFDTFSKR
jgi:hypothetical protein